jgi:hypothetical protein
LAEVESSEAPRLGIPIALTADASGFHFSLTKPKLKSGAGHP